MKKSTVLIVVVLMLFVATIVYTGTLVTMKCKKCDFSSEVSIGRGFKFEQLTGYCVECKEFVTIQWQRDGKAPKPLASIWDYRTGKTIQLFKCPKCSKAVAPIEEKMEYCPKCNEKAFEVDEDAGTIMYD
jgi:Zn finger protein HypA/HybF involved in hydrogenase expression